MSTNYDEKAVRIQKSSLIGFWPLGDESGTVALDIGPNGYNGVSSGLIRTSAYHGFVGPDGARCSRFDGSASHVDIVAAAVSSATGSQTTGSVSVWVAMDQANLAGTTKMNICRFAADTDNEIELYFDTTAYRFGCTFDGGATAVTNVSPLAYNMMGTQRPQWHHIGMTYSTGAMLIYLDGLSSTGTADVSSSTWSGNYGAALTVIGVNSTSGGNFFKGYLSKFGWWSATTSVTDKLLTAAEMRELAKAGP
jgi:hypothetical protein